eukprot:TRINITY_DN1342_c0_g1_i1.p1 TRINITY_DN1342_c0_g1~~TRINITY_DN1342_c0_g1_i1.p1  ORF type:complete len:722 (-),score=138.14 TRINITY_DN1342_c0_g1_i1:441-2483(-)
MANRMKEDEKNEKIIRGLLKLPGNKRCINCNSLGPQYVCTNFWTFVCTTCSGIHREFTHRVKSVSMAKFTSQEVTALQGGGNERAREIYFKEWDPQRHSIPDSRLRDFIKHVYVDRRYTGERSIDRPPRVKMAGVEDSTDNKRTETIRGGSRSPPYEDTYERRYSDRSSPGGRSDDRNYRYNYDERRSPGYEQETQRYGDYRRSPARFEVVDDRRRDDRFRNGSQNQRFEDRKFPDGASKPDGRSPNHQKDLDSSSPPVVRPVRDILGADIPPLRIGDPPKSTAGKLVDGSVHTQRTTSSSSMGSADGNGVELKRVNSGSLIDFNADPGPPVPTEQHASITGQSVPQPSTTPSIDGANWASFDLGKQEKAHQAPSNATTLESALLELSAPTTAPVGNMPALPVGAVDSFVKATQGGQWAIMQQHQRSLFPTADSHSTVSQFTPQVAGAPNNQPWSSSLASNVQGPSTAPTGQPFKAASKPEHETSTGIPSQPPPVVTKPSGRKELPEDIFTALYSSAPVSVPGWQTGPPQGMGLGMMQYPTAVTMPTIPHPSKSINPFDLNNDPTLVRVPTFPSMTSLQGALPNVVTSPGLLRSSSFGTPSQQWTPPQPPSYPSPVPPSTYMPQQAQINMPHFGHQGIGGGFGSEGAAFGIIGMDQQPAGRYSQPATPNSFSSLGGNPFG